MAFVGDRAAGTVVTAFIPMPAAGNPAHYIYKAQQQRNRNSRELQDIVQ
jgi:hypothetical protein